MEYRKKWLITDLYKFIERQGKKISILRAKYWNRIHWYQHYLRRYIVNNNAILLISILIFLVGLSLYLSYFLPYTLTQKFTNGINTEDFKVVLVTVGGALVGAGAISFSLVMFVLQVNIERMPHSLFWKFSSDKKIILTFTSILFLSLGIVGLSLFVSDINIFITMIIAIWAVIIVIILVIYAYRRTLMLINPIKQLSRIVQDVRAQFLLWEKRAKRARPLYQAHYLDDEYLSQDSHDFVLVQYFKMNPHWTTESQKGIDHAVSYSRRYAEYGDYTVSGYALDVIAEINALYIETKGKTFFSDNPLIKTPLSSDGFLNSTLEHLRQNLSFAFSRKDEQQIEQTLQAFRKLTFLYINIDYSNEESRKPHARLAIGYLSEGVKSALRHGFTDVVMEGFRLLGNIAFALVTTKSTNEITTIINDMGAISAGSAINEQNYPATATGVEELSRLTLILLQSEDMNVRFSLTEIKRNISIIAKTTLELSSPKYVTTHSSNLASYYSGTSFESLQAQLTVLTNSLIKAESDDEHSQQTLANIEEWADGIYQIEKELLLLAIEKRSNFTFDIISWITHLSKLLLALSSAEVCHFTNKNKFRNHALWLFSTLTWIKDDPDTISFVASYNITEKIFEMIIEARKREALEFSIKVEKMLFDWTFRAGKYLNGWGILENSIYALITVSLTSVHDSEGKHLIQDIKNKLQKVQISQEMRINTASNIRSKAGRLYQLSSMSVVERHMAQLERENVKSTLEEVASIFEGDNI